jgi:TPR repeat protein
MEISYEQAKKNYENNDLANSLPYVSQEAKKGNQEMLYALGAMYEQGLGVEQNENEAINNYKMAADKGNPKAQVFIYSKT